MAALQIIGIDLSTLFAAGAVFAVGIGFAMQNVAQNFVSGVILMVERSIKPGDVLSIGEEVVKVEKMGIRSTIVRTRDEEEVIVPNSILAQGVGQELHPQRQPLPAAGRGGGGVRLGHAARAPGARTNGDGGPVARGVEGAADPAARGSAAPRWTTGCSSGPTIRGSPGACCRISTSGSGGALKEAGIVIAFPQLDVHFDPPIEESLRRVAGKREG